MPTEQELQLALFQNFGPDVAHLRAARERLMQAKRAKNTRAAYANAVHQFEKWCLSFGHKPLPARPDSIELFVTWALDERRLKPDYVLLWMAGLTAHHVDQGFEDPVPKQARRLCTYAKRERAAAGVDVDDTDTKLGLTVPMLRRMSARLDTSNQFDIRNRAILVCGFALGWRAAELCSLNLSSIRWLEGDQLFVRLGKSKTDQEGKGREAALSPGKNKLTCPIRAMRAYLEVRGDGKGPLFLNREKGASPRFSKNRLTNMQILDIVQSNVAAIGENPQLYGSHSLRAGMITAAAEQGHSLATIMKRTGQKNVGTVMKYIRKAGIYEGDAMAGVL